MKSVREKLFNILEVPNNGFIGRNIRLLKLWGLFLPDNKIKRSLYLILHATPILFVIMQYIDIYMNRSDILSILRNIKYAIFATVNVVKVVTFIVRQERWKTIHKIVINIHDERSKSTDKLSKDIHDRFTFVNKLVTYVYFYFTYCTMFLISIQPLAQYLISSSYRENIKNGTEKRLEVVNAWLPVNKNTIRGYCIALVIQALMVYYSGGRTSSYDSNTIVIMLFIRTELELLRRDCQLLFGTIDKPISEADAKVRLAKCCKRHNDLLECTRLFNSCLSWVMLLYVIMCSCMLCATAYQFKIETSTMQKIITAEYLTFGITQLFLYCWHGNDVTYVSKDLIQGPYESIWWSRSLSEQRNLYILTAQLKKTFLFNAGPFTSITVITFINILKGAYSYYTLLSQSQE